MTGNRTHVGSVTPLWGTLTQGTLPTELPRPRLVISYLVLSFVKIISACLRSSETKKIKMLPLAQIVLEFFCPVMRRLKHFRYKKPQSIIFCRKFNFQSFVSWVLSFMTSNFKSKNKIDVAAEVDEPIYFWHDQVELIVETFYSEKLFRWNLTIHVSIFCLLVSIQWKAYKLVFTNLWIQAFFEVTCCHYCSKIQSTYTCINFQ